MLRVSINTSKEKNQEEPGTSFQMYDMRSKENKTDPMKNI